MSDTTLADLLDRLAENPMLDRAASLASEVTDRAFGGNEELRDQLQGKGTTGTPIHPAIVHFPIGGAVCAMVLDLAGLKIASGVVTALTAAAAVPTALTGFAEFSDIDAVADKRIGGAHYVAAATGSALSIAALAARLTRRHGAARMSLAGACAAFAAAGALGGHLVYGLDDEPDATDAGLHATNETASDLS